MLTDTQTTCIENVKRYIQEHLQEPLDRETLAAVAGFSIPHFHRVFTARVGESAASLYPPSAPGAGRTQARMGAVNITEVALAAGYDSHAAFSKAFRQQFGLAPASSVSLAAVQPPNF